MEAVTTIRRMLKDGKIVVPSYQRAYSWDADQKDISGHRRSRQVGTFLADLEEHIRVQHDSPYYLGHFLFEEKGRDQYAVIDGQQRLTTIVLFLSALFRHLSSIRGLTQDEVECREDTVKRGERYRFETVDYDNSLLRDYVIDGLGHSVQVETSSQRRITSAYDQFVQYVHGKDESYLAALLEAVTGATCTTHIVKSESEAVQMFLFQNNRGKSPSILEVVKARLMYAVHIGAPENDAAISIGKLKDRFEHIYRSSSQIEDWIDEDDVLFHVLRVYRNTLNLARNETIEEIDKLLEAESYQFAERLAQCLELGFASLVEFFTDATKDFRIESLVTLGGLGVAYPFIIKAYQYQSPLEDKAELCRALESIIVRHRVTRTHAELGWRLNEWFPEFTQGSGVKPVLEGIRRLKAATDEGPWWKYWHDENFERALQNGGLGAEIAKFLLWRYENYLRKTRFPQGYAPLHYRDINNPQLEHIAPRVRPSEVEVGYPKYTKEFLDNHLDSLGNYLLISGSHNGSIGNRPFKEKLKTYCGLEQQREIQEMVETAGRRTWSVTLIDQRRTNLIQFVMSEF